MEKKEVYLEEKEIQVKNLLSELYETESGILDKIAKTRRKSEEKINDLKSKHSDIAKKRKELEKKYKKLKKAREDKWEKEKEQFDLFLEYLEGDRDTFIHKAEDLIDDISDKIQELEKKTVGTATEMNEEIKKRINNLYLTKEEIQEKLEKVKTESSEKWMDIKQWFNEKSKAIKDYFASDSR
jgi:hypothetical protein